MDRIGNGQWDVPVFRDAVAAVLAEKRGFENVPIDREFGRVGRRKLETDGRRIEFGGKDAVLLVIRDLTNLGRKPD